jgi:hypothetical protein
MSNRHIPTSDLCPGHTASVLGNAHSVNRLQLSHFSLTVTKILIWTLELIKKTLESVLFICHFADMMFVGATSIASEDCVPYKAFYIHRIIYNNLLFPLNCLIRRRTCLMSLFHLTESFELTFIQNCKVIPCLSTTTWRHMGQWRYKSIHS